MPLTALMRNLSKAPVLISRAAVCTLTVPYGVMVTVAALGRWGSGAIPTGPIWTGRIRLSLSCSGSNRRSTLLPDSVATAPGGIVKRIICAFQPWHRASYRHIGR